MCPYLNLDPHQARILSDQKYGSVKSSPLVSPKCRCRQNNHSSEPTWPQSKRSLVHLRFPWSWWEWLSSQMVLSRSSEWIKLTMKPKDLNLLILSNCSAGCSSGQPHILIRSGVALTPGCYLGRIMGWWIGWGHSGYMISPLDRNVWKLSNKSQQQNNNQVQVFGFQTTSIQP